MLLPLPTWLSFSRFKPPGGSADLSQEPAGGSRRLRRRAVASALFAIAFGAMEAAAQMVGRSQPGSGRLLEGSLSPLRLLAAVVLSGAVCWGFLTLVDVTERRRARRPQSTEARSRTGRPARRRLALAAFLVPLAFWSLLISVIVEKPHDARYMTSQEAERLRDRKSVV